MSVLVSIGLGLALLIIGGEVLVRGASSAARKLGVSPLMIGLTLVGFGTSTPELVTSLQAAFAGSPGIAVGNVVGSNISNALLILGLTALIAPIAVDRRAFLRDGPMLALVTGAAVWVLLQGELTQRLGLIAVGVLAAYILLVWLLERKRPDAEGERIEDEADLMSGWRGSPWLALLLAVVGIGLTIVGARFLVDGSVSLARSYGVSDTVVGLTIVAVGTSMPELVTSVIAALRKQGDVALGNIIGSNLYNLLGILGITAIIKPIPVPPEMLAVDVWVLAGATAAVILFAFRSLKISRMEGLLLMAGYGGYMAWLLWSAGVLRP
ncbi:calcium/sodium antiporter [Caulobacter sp. SLTY]|uniref:calcium/sodium antiporter n=1 Tax=Caulobacter sp. SLTY TaxID=2683262 RepID=UPI0014123266|nr:calcium/sodium antiporter [Caulobacter sp. SLTY]NBB15128.1 calcium/sodium antiporter [Caulobacter sp. SLTY]